MNTGKLKRSTQIAIMTGAGSGAVEKTVTGPAPITLSDSVAGNILGITVKGHSALSAGSIVSIGDAGWGVVDLGTLTWARYTPENGNPYFQASISGMYSETEKLNEDLYCPVYQLPAQPISARNLSNLQIMRYETNIYIRNDTYTDATAFKSAMSGVLLYYPLADTTGATPTLGITSKNGAGQGTAATIITGLPLRSTTDGTVYDELTNEKVITRCEVVEDEVVPLATPTETPLTSAETTALSALETYDPTTVISITDNPSITVKYMGKRAARTAPKKRTNRKKKS